MIDDEAHWMSAIEAELGGKTICRRCNGRLCDYQQKCDARLDERCPGFDAIDEAIQRHQFSEQPQ